MPKESPEQKSTKTLLDEIVSEMFQAWNDYSDSERPIAIQDALQIKGLPATAANEERIEHLVEERIRGPVDAPYLEGDEWGDEEDTAWIWDQWIAQGFCNVLIAAQKTGKSTFFLSLVAELSKRTGSFLNFSFSEKKEIGFVLVGPDMNRRLWKDYGQKAGLLTRKDNGKLVWASSIKAVYTEETGIGLDRKSINTIAGHCKSIAAEGKHPFVICDSYSALMANSHPNSDENSANYTNPLRKLKQALGKEGATLLMIHHSSIGGSKRDTATSASGHQNWGRVPDQILTLKWLQAEPGPDGTRADHRVVLSATGRTGSVAKAQLLEQSPNWGWSSHGDTSDALRYRHALEQRDKLIGDDATLYDLINIRTRNGKSSSIRDVMELHATTSRAPWNESKTRRLVKKLARKCLVHDDQELRTQPGDFGGRPSTVWWTFERGEDDANGAIDVHQRPGGSSLQPFKQVSCMQETSQDGVTSGNCTKTDKDPEVVPAAFIPAGNGWRQGMSWEDSPTFHDSDDFPKINAIIEDAEGQPFQVVEPKPAAQILRVQKKHDRNAPIKECRWMLDVFPVGHKAKTDEEVLACLLDPDKEI